MLTKAQIRYIRSLKLQKGREESKVFIAEGKKLAEEWLLSDWKIEMIIGVNDWVSANEYLLKKHPEAELTTVEDHELAQVSLQQTPNQVLLVCRQPEVSEAIIEEKWYLALDDIQDPGNMGTIIRIADWFGINDIFCSPDCVEIYNPKVVQSAMGGHLRVNMHSVALDSILLNAGIPKLAAVLDGESLFSANLPGHGIIVIGNESKGISSEIVKLCDYRISIPRLGGAESLNAGVSAGIICAVLTKK